MKISELRLVKGERGFIAGQNGTGKSYLSRFLLPVTGDLCIIDPKGLYKYNVPVYTDVRKILRDKPKRFMYQPTEKNFDDYASYNELLTYCYHKGNIFVYIDEVIPLLDNMRGPKALQACYQLGRQKGITMLTVSQRPARIPMFLITEAQRFYIFRLNAKDDRKRMMDTVSEYPAQANRFEFMYKNLNTEDPIQAQHMPKGLD